MKSALAQLNVALTGRHQVERELDQWGMAPSLVRVEPGLDPPHCYPRLEALRTAMKSP